MGIGASFFYGRGKIGDAGVQFVDGRDPTANKADALNNKSPGGVGRSDRNPSPIARFLDMTPKQRAATFGEASDITYVKRDKNALPHTSNYSPSPIKSCKTSPSSYKVSSETVLAYPSPTKLHSPLMSYVTSKNRVVSPIIKSASPARPDQDSISLGSSNADEDDDSLERGKKYRFYSSIPSPSWRSLSRHSCNDSEERSPSLSPDRPWIFPTSQWGDTDVDGKQSRRMEQMYYLDENGTFNTRSPRERRYF